MTKLEKQKLQKALETAWKDLNHEAQVCEMLNQDTDTDESYRRALTKWVTIKEIVELLGVN